MLVSTRPVWAFGLVLTIAISAVEATADPCFPDAWLPGNYFHGLDFGPYVHCQQPGDSVPPAQIQQRLEIIAPYTHEIRTYGARLGLEEIPCIAKNLGLSVAMGTWVVDYGGGERAEEINNLVAKALLGCVDIAVVGNEELYSGRETCQSLADLVTQVRTQLDAEGLTHVPVTTPEPFETLFQEDGTPKCPQVLEAVDVVFVNIYPFHEGVPIDDAVTRLADRYWAAVAGAPGKQVVIAETGWPSAGETKGQAVPSCENAARYLQECVSWADSNGVGVFYFEAFDEDWKGPPKSPNAPVYEQHWGVWDEDGDLKLPEPCSLGLLTIGAMALLRRRRPYRAIASAAPVAMVWLLKPPLVGQAAERRPVGVDVDRECRKQAKGRVALRHSFSWTPALTMRHREPIYRLPLKQQYPRNAPFRLWQLPRLDPPAERRAADA